MNTNLLIGGIFGAVAVTAAGSYAGYNSYVENKTPSFAEVISSKPVTETYYTNREECYDEVVQHQAEVKDQNKVTGTIIGAVIGGVIGKQVGGGNGKNLPLLRAPRLVAMPVTRFRAICSRTTCIPPLNADATRLKTLNSG